MIPQKCLVKEKLWSLQKNLDIKREILKRKLRWIVEKIVLGFYFFVSHHEAEFCARELNF